LGYTESGVQLRGFRRRALGIHGLAPIVDALVKERLTGAIILVALIVLLVPELLHGPIRPASRVRGPAALTEEPPLRAYTINLADETHGGSVALQPEAPTPVAPAVEPVAGTPPPAASSTPPAQSPVPIVTPTQHPVPQAAAATKADTTPSSKPATSSKGGWVVQLGSFASAANAERLAQQVRKGGFPVGVSRAATGRRLYRVQVGPVHDRASAEQMAGKLRAMGHSGSIVPK
jgi:DedD protein